MTADRYSAKQFWERRYHKKRMMLLEKILKQSFANSQTFIDIGCGTGEYLIFARRNGKFAIGLDISRRYLSRCKTNNANDLIIGDAKSLPFRDNVFDCVLCSEVLEHIKFNDNVIKEAERISRKSVVISTPNHGLYRVIMSRLGKRKLASIDGEVGHVNIVKFQEFMLKIHSTSWKISTAFTVQILPPFLDSIHVPKAAEPLISLIESIMDNLLPQMGSVTVVDLTSTAIS